MATTHNITFIDAVEGLKSLKSESVDLVVTSPPYPMIEMWDEIFIKQNLKIDKTLSNQNGFESFELMHKELDKVWKECFRVLTQGGIMCVNIGDATRKLGKDFQLYSSHSRILQYCTKIGFQNLPNILWRKQTNAPNKFMGSGMLPPGAYVTLEHEYILVLRKAGKRQFTSTQEKNLRRESAYFWEERNTWFSDIWYDLKGVSQELNHKKLRERSGAFPFELAYRIINMFSIKEDLILDPFLGTGTSTLAAMIAERNSCGFEIDCYFEEIIEERISQLIPFGNNIIHKRLRDHLEFVQQRREKGKHFKNLNRHYKFPCISNQESNLVFYDLQNFEKIDKNSYHVYYDSSPQEQFCQNNLNDLSIPSEPAVTSNSDIQVSIFE